MSNEPSVAYVRELLVYVFRQKVLPYLNNFTNQHRTVCQRQLSFLFFYVFYIMRYNCNTALPTFYDGQSCKQKECGTFRTGDEHDSISSISHRIFCRHRTQKSLICRLDISDVSSSPALRPRMSPVRLFSMSLHNVINVP